MIRVAANLCKKVPIQGLEFSSQQYGAAIDVEVSDTESPDVLRARIKDLYGLLSQAVDEQIAQAQTSNPAGNAPSLAPPTTRDPLRGSATSPTNRLSAPSHQVPGNGKSNGRSNNGRVNATAAQCRAIYAITKDLGEDLASILADFNAVRPEELHIRDASRLIDSLKKRQNGSPR